MSPSRPIARPRTRAGSLGAARGPNAGRLHGVRMVEGDPGLGRGLRIAVAVARFNEAITERLLDGALAALGEAGVLPSDVTVVRVPGAFELPFAAGRLAASKRFHAVVCLGAVVRGDTPHFDFVASEAARGIADAAERTDVPVLFGVLTTNTARQALDRAGGRLGNRGGDAARAAIEMARVAGRLPSPRRA